MEFDTTPSFCDVPHMVTLFKAAPEADEGRDSYVNALEQENITCQTIAPIEFKFVNLEDLKAKLNAPETYAGLILSSPRCVTALKEALGNEPLNPVWNSKPCFAVGPATGNLAYKLFDLKCLGTDSGKGANLAPIIISSLVESSSTSQAQEDDQPLLMPASNIALDTISEALADAEIEVDAPVVYETFPKPGLKEQIDSFIQPDVRNVFVFFSPSGAEATVPLLNESILKSAAIIAIGTTTEAALRDLGIECKGVCARPNPENVVYIAKVGLLPPPPTPQEK